jgi:hypothetical protein
MVEIALRMGSPLPPELTDIIICKEMGWSWQELMDTPADVVDDVRVWLAKRALIAEEQRQLAEARRRGE